MDNGAKKEEKLLKKYLMGASIRSLSLDIGKSVGAVYNQIEREMSALPQNNDVTAKYCTRFQGVLVVDGKYVKVKGYEKKIPFVYGIDYLTHDIPVCLLAPSENYVAMKQFFMKCKNAGYRPKIVVCDDNKSIQKAAKDVFPKCLIQLCHVHFLENIRRHLRTRSDPTYRPFIEDLQKWVFRKPRLGRKKLKRWLFELMQELEKDAVKVAILQHVFDNRRYLTGYVDVASKYELDCPKSTNLIECYNKHLNGRLKTIQGFESFASAKLWLNAWVLYRRTKIFTSCSKKFKQLNGLYSLQRTRSRKKKLPHFF